MNENIKVGITGPISEINFGDYAMVVNNIYDLNVNDITLFTYNKGFSDLITNDYLSSYNIRTIEVQLQESSIIKQDLFEEVANRQRVGYLPFNFPTETPLDILYRLENIEELREEIEELDLLIVNGGGYFNHLWNNSLWRTDMLKKIIAPILLASQLNKKIYFTGNGIGPFDQSEEFFNYIFNYLKNTTFAVRDRMYSPGYLKRIGIENIQFIPDDLYIINNQLEEKVAENRVNILQGVGKYIVLEIYYPLEEIESYINDIKEFSKKIHEKYGLSIIFIPFDFNRGGTWQGEYLNSQLSNFYLYNLNEKGYLPIEDLKQIIKNAELVICTRYHAMVLSVGAGVPVINMIKKVCDDHRYYFNKNYGLLEYAFEGLNFNEMDFMRIDFIDTLKYLGDNLTEIIEKQKALYSSKKYLENKNTLSKIRTDYLGKVIEG